MSWVRKNSHLKAKLLHFYMKTGEPVLHTLMHQLATFSFKYIHIHKNVNKSANIYFHRNVGNIRELCLFHGKNVRLVCMHSVARDTIILVMPCCCNTTFYVCVNHTKNMVTLSDAQKANVGEFGCDAHQR